MSTSQPSPRGENEELSQREQLAWRSFLSVSTRCLEHIDQLLQQNSRMTLTDYEILLALSGAENERLRMSELADRVLVSRSRLTYRVDRLAEVALVTREECEDDRRGLWAILTDQGRQTLDGAMPGHHASIRRLFFDPIDGRELDAVEDFLGRISAKLDAI